eukprot:sb/3469719/
MRPSLRRREPYTVSRAFGRILATLACNNLPSSLPHLPVRIKGCYGGWARVKLVKTLRCLEKESNIIIGSLDEDAAFLRDLVMDGEWDNVLEYLNPFKEDTGYKNVKLAVEKQRYLELLATEQNSYDPGLVMKSLTLLEDLCPTRHEYTGLCYLLTRPRLCQHPAYANWTHYESRLECFQLVYNQFFSSNSKWNIFISRQENLYYKVQISGVVMVMEYPSLQH